MKILCPRCRMKIEMQIHETEGLVLAQHNFVDNRDGFLKVCECPASGRTPADAALSY